MLENIDNCPVCGWNEQRTYLTCQDYTVSGEKFTIQQCNKCQFKFTSPRPSEKDIGLYYQSEAYISHSNSSKGAINKLYQAVRKKTLADKLRLVNKLHTKRRLLDIGCGTGDFLKACNEDGWETKGVEADEGARKSAIINSNSEVQAQLLNAYSEQQFEVITLWHVLEHLHELESSLIKIKQLLVKEGTLIIAVPNSESYDAKIYGKYWAAYDVPRHLYHFSQNTLARLLDKYGLKIVEIKPMKFDAFYISMLSTKYKYGKTKYLESLKNGALSNTWAAKHGKNYSSITYIISR